MKISHHHKLNNSNAENLLSKKSLGDHGNLTYVYNSPVNKISQKYINYFKFIKI